jgi:hypothetical protein
MGVNTSGKPMDRGSPNPAGKKGQTSGGVESPAKRPQKHLLDHVNVSKKGAAGMKGADEDENM